MRDSLQLTPLMIRSCYDFLNTTEPFLEWNLPDSDDIIFRVGKDASCYGWHLLRNGRHTIVVSSATVGHTLQLVTTVSHEMIHIHEHIAKTATRGVKHNRAFAKYSAIVARIHGFDPKGF